MKVLVVGSGGREHALAWALRRSPRVSTLWIAPGNAGTRALGENVSIAADDIDGLLAFARAHAVDLTVVGPEGPLIAGIVDRFRAEGCACYGPVAAAARLEGSKGFAKEFMRRHAIPTAAFAVFDDAPAARAFARSLAPPVVIKADGLAAGKGVVIAESHEDADRAIDAMLLERRFGESGARVVVEEFLLGEEVSVHAVCAGGEAVLLPTSQDHKRAYDDDRGPNTGGMGAIAPVPWVGADDMEQVRRTILAPVLEGMRAAGTPFTGTLYAGLMWTTSGPKVLEFNVRFGDPETEVLMPLLDGDVATLLADAAADRVPAAVTTRAGAAATVVVAAGGYPERVDLGAEVRGLDAPTHPDTAIFHSGTRVNDGRVVVSGGRVLAISAWAPALPDAVDAAYRAVQGIHIDGAFHRTDIGRRHLTGRGERIKNR